jgi:uncharacterized protein (DUF885 family)
MMPLLLHACARPVPPAAPTDPAPSATASVGAQGVANPLLARVVSEHWEAQLARDPVFATDVGDHRYDDRWPDPSEAALGAWSQQLRRTELALVALPDDLLSRRDRVTRDLLLEDVRAELAERACRFETWSVSARSNDLTDLRSVVHQVESSASADRAAALGALAARLRAWPALADARSANLRRGLAEGRVSNRTSVEKVVAMYDTALAEAVDDSPEVKAFAEASPELRAEVRALVEAAVRPALARQRDLLRDEVLPQGARTGDQPGPRRACPTAPPATRPACGRSTTLPLAPAELHASVGSTEMARIHEELRVAGPEGARHLGPVAAMFARLRGRPGAEASPTAGDRRRAWPTAALRRAEAAVPKVVRRGLPRHAVRAWTTVPDYEAPYTSVAYYEPGLPDGSRPGALRTSTCSRRTTRPRHEAAGPGRSTSRSPATTCRSPLNRELGRAARVPCGTTAVRRVRRGLGAVRRAPGGRAGAVHARSVDRLGMLSYDAWRAGRLVVDTGMHQPRAGRASAPRAWLLEANTPLMRDNVIVNEVDRYVDVAGAGAGVQGGPAPAPRAADRSGAAARPRVPRRRVPPGPARAGRRHAARARGPRRALDRRPRDSDPLRGARVTPLPPSLLSGDNAAFLDEQYTCWLDEPASVEPTLRALFDELGPPTQHGARWGAGPTTPSRSVFAGGQGAPTDADPAAVRRQARVVLMINAFRVRGHLDARIDPLGRRERAAAPRAHARLRTGASARPTWPLSRRHRARSYGVPATAARSARCVEHLRKRRTAAAIGAEFMNIDDPEQKLWVQEQLETLPVPRSVLDRQRELRVLRKLCDAENFERMLHGRFPGTKRFSPGGRRDA